MKITHIISSLLFLGITPSVFSYAGRAPGYVPLPKEVLTSAEYKDIYTSDVPFEKRLSKLKTLLKKTTNPYRRQGINRAIRETEFSIRASR